MERKDYEEKFRTVKNDILDEIRKILGYNAKHDFSEPFFIHYVEGEVATTEECVRIEIDNDGMVIVVYRMQGDFETFTTEGDSVFHYSCDSFLDILDHLQKEVREKKLDIIRELLKNNGGRIDVKENFEFLCADEGDKNTLSHSYLKGVEIDGEKILVKTIWKEDGERYDYHEHCLTNDELNGIIDCLRKNTYREFVVRVSGSFSRTFDINASSYEEALALAKKQWEETPLYSGDSNGEDWDDYTDYPH